MYKLLIVDDEKIVIEGLNSAINWNENQIELVGSASCGKEALQKIVDMKPDIVLQDIRIPGINGLDLIQQAKQLNLDTVFIIISGYSEFSYAKRAIELEAIDYLVKPIEVEEILTSIKKAICKFDKLKEEKQIDKRMKLYETALDEKQVLEFILGNQNVHPDVLRNVNEYSFTVIDFKGFREEPSLEEKIHFITIGIKALLTEKGLQAFPYSIDKTITILVSNSSQITDFLDGVFKLVSKYHNSDVAIGISQSYFDFSKVNHAYQEAKDLVKLGIFTNKIFTTYTDLENMNNIIGPSMIEEIDQYFTICKSDVFLEINDMIDHIINYSKQSRLSPNKSKFLCFKWAINLLEYIENEFELTNPVGERHEIYEKLNSLDSLDEMKAWLRRLASQMTDMLNNHKISYNDKLIMELKSYLKTHFREPIVLEELGEHFYKSPAYLCSLFSRSAGKTIFEYITILRMNSAKELLRTSNYKVSEIATKVGYENDKYFYQVFKKNIGITPSQYRSQHLVK
ncbi:response regulator [Metabacillus litoralis]|uniref:Stage 0 sporulation protein A homolog n=1 Tax=Metabacillus litoralis TaxID=152268 RepID=A0A179T774_9BACI|nr:response regulator [Metabacillus litoralis]OAS89230.1 hypothetical protein A6K24_01355 [Metabacillus litoralis]